MEQLFNLIFYIATGLSVLTIVCVWLGEVRLNNRRFVWYFYIPHALINTVLGVLAPTVLWNGILSLVLGSAGFWPVIWIILWAAGLVANNLVFILLFHNNDDFSPSLYWCTGLTGLFILSFWLLQILPFS